MIPSPKGFLGSGQPNGLPPKPDLSRYVQIREAEPPPSVREEPAPVPINKPCKEAKPAKIQPRPKLRSVASNSVRGKVLEVLRGQTGPISVEEVAIACWRRWPEQFGMSGYPQYPCTNTVYAKLATLTTEGYVYRPRMGMVRITPEGAVVCASAREPVEVKPT